MILLVVCWQWRLFSKVNLLNDDTYRCDSATIIMSSFGQIEQGAILNKEILNSINEESISGAHSCRASLTRSLPRVFENVSRPLKCHSNFIGSHITPARACVCRVTRIHSCTSTPEYFTYKIAISIVYFCIFIVLLCLSSEFKC